MRGRLLFWIFIPATLSIVSGCRHRKNITPAVAPPAVQAPADLPAPVPPTPMPVAAPEPVQPPAEAWTTDVAEANRVAHDRGWIADAFYGFDSSTLSDSAQNALHTSAAWLNSHRDYGLRIEGHCDERGTEQYNLALGERRAGNARTFLIAAGVDADRITVMSYGEEQPFATGHNEESWSQNRRAHLVLLRSQ